LCDFEGWCILLGVVPDADVEEDEEVKDVNLYTSKPRKYGQVGLHTEYVFVDASEHDQLIHILYKRL
jgi:hypothetical protein